MLRFQDPLSKWGTGATARTNMLNSEKMWLAVPSSFAPDSTVNRFTGGWSLKQTALGFSTGTSAKYSLGGAMQTFGNGICIRITQLPSADFALFSLLAIDGTVQLTYFVRSDGSVCVKRGDFSSTSILGSPSAAGVMTIGSFIHWETIPFIAEAVSSGAVELRINKVARVTATGVDTRASSSLDECSIVALGPQTGGSCGDVWFESPFAYDLTGAKVNTWQGNKISYPLDLVGNHSGAGLDDWTVVGAAGGYQALNEAALDVTKYIEAAAAGNESEFDIGAPPSWLSGIVAMSAMPTQALDSPGSSQTQLSLRGTSGSYTTGTDRVIPYPTPTTFMDHWYANPDGAADLLYSTIPNMRIRAKRTV